MRKPLESKHYAFIIGVYLLGLVEISVVIAFFAAVMIWASLLEQALR
jgi:hypothetical protein